MPGNMGAASWRSFARSFRRSRAEKHAALVPFLLEGVGGDSEPEPAGRDSPHGGGAAAGRGKCLGGAAAAVAEVKGAGKCSGVPPLLAEAQSRDGSATLSSCYSHAKCGGESAGPAETATGAVSQPFSQVLILRFSAVRGGESRMCERFGKFAVRRNTGLHRASSLSAQSFTNRPPSPWLHSVLLFLFSVRSSPARSWPRPRSSLPLRPGRRRCRSHRPRSILRSMRARRRSPARDTVPGVP